MKNELPESVVPNPCRSICKYNVDRYCIGCGRQMKESWSWHRMSDDDKLAVIDALEERLKALAKGDLGGGERGPYRVDMDGNPI